MPTFAPMDHHIFELPNGIRLLYKPSASNIAHACILINAGSRDEQDGKPGMAHFIEHMLFKRTERRTTNQILNRLELVGADLNAYTTKEYTCIHASFLQPHLERALDLFEDLVFHSVFPEEELDKEKGVILDEIASYLDQPEDAVQDDFEGLLYKDHPMGNNILGTTASVQDFTRNDIFDFLAENYATSGIVIGVLGNYPFEKLKKLITRLFGDVKENTSSKARKAPAASRPLKQVDEKPISQAHYVTGCQTYPMHHTHKTGLLLLNNLLGGTGMSSRLNLEIREKYGIAYTVESSYTPFTDTGIFTVYFGTDPEKVDKALTVLNRELRKLRDRQLGVIQLQQAKQKFIGLIALGEENRMGLIISMAKSLLDFNRVDTLEEIFDKVNDVSAPLLLEVANETFDPAQFTTLLFQPGN